MANWAQQMGAKAGKEGFSKRARTSKAAKRTDNPFSDYDDDDLPPRQFPTASKYAKYAQSTRSRPQQPPASATSKVGKRSEWAAEVERLAEERIKQTSMADPQQQAAPAGPTWAQIWNEKAGGGGYTRDARQRRDYNAAGRKAVDNDPFAEDIDLSRLRTDKGQAGSWTSSSKKETAKTPPPPPPTPTSKPRELKKGTTAHAAFGLDLNGSARLGEPNNRLKTLKENHVAQKGERLWTCNMCKSNVVGDMMKASDHVASSFHQTTMQRGTPGDENVPPPAGHKEDDYERVLYYLSARGAAKAQSVTTSNPASILEELFSGSPVQATEVLSKAELAEQEQSGTDYTDDLLTSLLAGVSI